MLPARGGGPGGFAPVNEPLVPPIRAAYYFPWYDEGWDQFSYLPFTRYTPSLGAYYDQNDQAVLTRHAEWAAHARLDALIPTWRGRPDGVGISYATFMGGGAVGPDSVNWSPYTDGKIVVLMNAALQHGFKVAMLYEIEGYATPTQAQIEAEFAWLAANRFTHPAYLHVDDRPVVFVYTGEDKSNTLCAKYSAATAGFTTAYIAMQTVNDPSGATPQPDAWFTFTADRTSVVGNSYTICPGFWRIDEANARTSRDLATWQANIASMVASGADWQLIITFNEWGEGSQVEPETAHGTDYLDALHNG
jgi:hypothetical protein